MREEQVNKIALSKGVPAAERAALKDDKRPLRVAADGIFGLDTKHLLVEGRRSFAAIGNGAVFYNPVLDEVAIVSPQGSSAWITVGPLEAMEILKGLRRSRWNKVLQDAVQYASQAPDDGVEKISRWLASRIKEAVVECLQHTSVSGAHTILVKREPEAIWRGLGAAWVTQPWGIPLPPEALGELV
jgi:hypothetical protein